MPIVWQMLPSMMRRLKAVTGLQPVPIRSHCEQLDFERSVSRIDVLFFITMLRDPRNNRS